MTLFLKKQIYKFGHWKKPAMIFLHTALPVICLFSTESIKRVIVWVIHVPDSGAGWFKACGQEASDRGKPGTEEERGEGENTAQSAGAHLLGVGADSYGDGGSSPHQCPGHSLETETQVPSKRPGCVCNHAMYWYVDYIVQVVGFSDRSLVILQLLSFCQLFFWESLLHHGNCVWTVRGQKTKHFT